MRRDCQTQIFKIFSSASAIHTPNIDSKIYHQSCAFNYTKNSFMHFVLHPRLGKKNIEKLLRNLPGDGIISHRTATIKLEIVRNISWWLRLCSLFQLNVWNSLHGGNLAWRCKDFSSIGWFCLHLKLETSGVSGVSSVSPSQAAATELKWRPLGTLTLSFSKQEVKKPTSSLLKAWVLIPYTTGLHMLFA